MSKETEEQSSICILVIVGKDIGGSTRFGQNKTGSSSMIGFTFSFVLGISVVTMIDIDIAIAIISNIV